MRSFFLFSVCMLVIATLTTTSFAQRPPQGPTGVIVQSLEKQTYGDVLEALGTTKANESTIITAETAEKVVNIHFEDGQAVSQGDLLITLDKSEEEAALKAAKALKQENLAAYNRAKNLAKTSALSKGTLEERLALLEQSNAQIEEIQARIEKRVIKAPFNGILGLRNVSAGTLIQPGDQITTLDDLNIIKVDFDIPSIYLPSIKKDMPITGTTQTYKNQSFSGYISAIDSKIDPTTRSVTVRALIPNEDGLLKAGMLFRIKLIKNERQALLLPEEALIKKGNDNFVYLIKEENDKPTAHLTKITLGTRNVGHVEVTEGLSEGDKVVTHGVIKLRDGANVTIKAVETNDEPLKELLQQKQGK